MRRYRRRQDVWIRRMDWKDEHPPKVQEMKDPKEQDRYLDDYLKEKRGVNLTAAQRNQIDLEIRQNEVAMRNMRTVKAREEAARQAEATATTATTATAALTAASKAVKPRWKNTRSKVIVPVPSVYKVPVKSTSPRVLKASSREIKKFPLETKWQVYKENNDQAEFAPVFVPDSSARRKVRKAKLSRDEQKEKMPLGVGVGKLGTRERLKRKQELIEKRKLSFEYEEKASKVDENCKSEIAKLEQAPLVR